MDHFPSQLSGGEQQRVAIARAFSNRPRILFADEPTGNLDANTGGRIVELIEELNRESGASVVLVTHDLTLAARAGRMIRLADGIIVEDRESRESAGAREQRADGNRGLEAQPSAISHPPSARYPVPDSEEVA